MSILHITTKLVKTLQNNLTALIYSLVGKLLITADALSRAPITSFPESEEELHKSVDMYVYAILSTLPATDKRIKQLLRSQTEGEVCQQLITFCTEGWPNKNRVPGIINPLRTVVAYMRQGNKLDYHVQTNHYNFMALHPSNLKLLSFCSVYSAENSNVLGRT